MKEAASSPWWRYWAPPVVWTLGIVVVSGSLGTPANTSVIFKWVLSWIASLDPKSLETSHFYFRKFLHVMCYGVLTILWLRALMVTFPRRFRANAVIALGLSLLVALVDEGHQYLAPGRTSSWRDIGLDMTGGILFLFIYSRCWQKRNRLPAGVESPPPRTP